MRNEKIKHFQKSILIWFEVNGRDFPWRKNSASNYEKIISEVLLQRTKAETVAKFFLGFLKIYPSWKQLGDATESELQKALKPIGLNIQRGARLYKLAQELKKRNGRFPSIRSEVEEFSMMGQYITNAFEVFIQKKPSPLLDVNMARVLERYFGPRKLSDIRYDPHLQKLAKDVVTHEKFKELNWGILDFASAICKARKPLCDECLLNINCQYFINNKINS